MDPADLLAFAANLLGSTPGRPTQVALRRATSSIYYALFHCLARDGADLLVGSAGASRSVPAWRQVYRALDHGYAKQQCRNTSVIGRFHRTIQNFAALLTTLQSKRHDADYDPAAMFTKSGVQQDISLAQTTIDDYRKLPARDRRAFCVWLLLKDRRS